MISFSRTLYDVLNLHVASITLALVRNFVLEYRTWYTRKLNQEITEQEFGNDLDVCVLHLLP